MLLDLCLPPTRGFQASIPGLTSPGRGREAEEGGGIWLGVALVFPSHPLPGPLGPPLLLSNALESFLPGS